MRVFISLLLLKSFLLLAIAALDLDCGQRKVNTVFLVHHGRAAKEGYWPWHATIWHRYRGTFSYTCGGSIIDRNTILTAAHCLVTPNGFIPVDRLSVQVGRTRLYVGDGRIRSYEPDRFIVHPQFKHDDVHDDIALIKLTSDIEFTNFIQPVCLWNKGVDESELVGQVGSIVGFGLSEADEISDYLREAEVPVVSFATCVESNRETFGQKLTTQMYCAGAKDGVSACNGDSGGGMFFEFNSTWYVRGLVSFTPSRQGVAKCDPYEYTVYTDVAKYLGWIRQGHKHTQLNLDTCGFNKYPFRNESAKPVFLNYPWNAVVYSAPNETEPLCNAVLISEWYLLTTARCVIDYEHSFGLAVRLGDYDLSTTTDCVEVEGQRRCAPPPQIVLIDTIIVHRQFDRYVFISYNIALLKLRERAQMEQDNIKPICLPVIKDLRETQPNEYVQTGWSEFSPVLHRMAVNRAEQENFVNCLYDGLFICVFWKRDGGSTNISPITGAPLQVIQNIEGSYRYVLQGLRFSFTYVTALGPSNLYVNVSAFMDWILEKLEPQEESSFAKGLIFA